MNLELREAEAGRARLAGAEHVALAAQAKVLLGDAEAVLGRAQDLDPRLRRLAERPLVEQEAARPPGAAADPPAQLMELREAEPLGVLDDHDRGLGHVDADLDDRGRDQDAAFRRAGSAPSPRPCRVRPSFRARARRTSPKIGAQRLGAILGGGDVERLALLDQRTDPVGARALVERPRQARDDLLEPLDRHGAGVDRLPSRRFFAQRRDVHVAEIGEHERARDRRRGHHQKIRGLSLAGERETLPDAEAVLLVDDREAEIGEHDALLEERVGADDGVERPGRERR